MCFMTANAPPTPLRTQLWIQRVKIAKGQGVETHSLAHNTLGVEGHARALGWGLGRVASKSISHTNLHKLNNKLVSA
jgi:hypothetical protein